MTEAATVPKKKWFRPARILQTLVALAVISGGVWGFVDHLSKKSSQPTVANNVAPPEPQPPSITASELEAIEAKKAARQKDDEARAKVRTDTRAFQQLIAHIQDDLTQERWASLRDNAVTLHSILADHRYDNSLGLNALGSNQAQDLVEISSDLLDDYVDDCWTRKGISLPQDSCFLLYGIDLRTSIGKLDDYMESKADDLDRQHQ